MIERHVLFNVLPGREQAFGELFVREYRPAMAEMPGFVRVELLRAQGDPTKLMMVIRFESAEQAAAWRTSPEHQALKPKIGPLYDGSSVEVFDVIA
ncbi:MAG TPA: antibiotic biosynthesis monooxygenase [Anaerolineae bacterium]|nr:antibiotic biosynthesis monooxygenase [Anaerolineae bacterium]